jgi:hypothetical protein
MLTIDHEFPRHSVPDLMYCASLGTGLDVLRYRCDQRRHIAISKVRYRVRTGKAAQGVRNDERQWCVVGNKDGDGRPQQLRAICRYCRGRYDSRHASRQRIYCWRMERDAEAADHALVKRVISHGPCVSDLMYLRYRRQRISITGHAKVGYSSGCLAICISRVRH